MNDSSLSIDTDTSMGDDSVITSGSDLPDIFTAPANKFRRGERNTRSLGDVLDILGKGQSIGRGNKEQSNVRERRSSVQLGRKFKGAAHLAYLLSKAGASSDGDTMPAIDRGRRGTVHGTQLSSSFQLLRGAHRRKTDPQAIARERRLDAINEDHARKDAKAQKLWRKAKVWTKAVMHFFSARKRFENKYMTSITYKHQMEQIDKDGQPHDGGTSGGTVLGSKRINKEYFKADKQMKMPQDQRVSLTKPSEDRTATEIHNSTLYLRNVKIIGEYSTNIQKAFAKYGYFECYDPKRFIVRQGQRSENYYVVTYGQVLIAKIDRDGNTPMEEEEFSKTAVTLTSLKRGDDFGELGIYHGTARASTIITETYTELLRVSAEDFKEIVMGGNKIDPDKDPFLLGQSFLKGWPLEVLKENPKKFITSYVQRNTVMEYNSQRSDWLYIVKSGSIRVLKKLVKTLPNVCPKTAKYTEKAHTDGFNAFMTKDTEYQRYTKYNNIVTPPPLCLEDVHSKEASILTDRPSTTDRLNSTPLVQRLEQIIRPRTALFHIATPESKLHEESLQRPTKSAFHINRKKTTDLFSSRATSIIQKVKEENEENMKPDQNKEHVGRRTIFDDWDAVYRQAVHEITEADRNPEFVRVQTLKKGDVFGLQYVVFEDQPQPSLIVVSNGADCVRISRKLFKKHMQLDMKLKEKLRKEISPYPTDEELQSCLVTRVNWEAYKDINLNHLLGRIHARNPQKHGPRYRPFRYK